jgi:uncharacterized membrane protein YgdD (TMEM256/DUF423 family)
MTSRLALILASVAMFTAVALGAFGAHALKARLTPDLAAVWQTAVQYHAWHGLALFGVGLLLAQDPGRGGVALAGWFFVAGIVIFSGSLYALAFTGIRGLGAVTPIGGLALLAGWAVLAWAMWRA